MTFHILFDDVRNLNGMDFIIRTWSAMEKFIDTFDTSGHVIYMDNDVSEVVEEEGQYILESLLFLGQRPKMVVLVTSNIVARSRMAANLQDYGYKPALDGITFHRNY